MSTDLRPGIGGAMEPRAALEEKALSALRDAAQLVFDQTGLRIDQVVFTWGPRTFEGGVTKTVVRRVNMSSVITRSP